MCTLQGAFSASTVEPLWHSPARGLHPMRARPCPLTSRIPTSLSPTTPPDSGGRERRFTFFICCAGYGGGVIAHRLGTLLRLEVHSLPVSRLICTNSSRLGCTPHFRRALCYPTTPSSGHHVPLEVQCHSDLCGTHFQQQGLWLAATARARSCNLEKVMYPLCAHLRNRLMCHISHISSTPLRARGSSTAVALTLAQPRDVPHLWLAPL